MDHVNVKASLNSIKSGLNEDEQVGYVEWIEVGGDRYIAHYSTGLALFTGPIQGNNWECQCENQATLDEVTSRAISVGPLKTEARGSKPLRDAAALRNKRSICNSSNQVVGYTPEFVICGTSTVASFLGDEDPDDAEVLGDLDSLPKHGK